MEKCIYVEVEKRNEQKKLTREKLENFFIHSKLQSVHIKHIYIYIYNKTLLKKYELEIRNQCANLS